MYLTDPEFEGCQYCWLHVSKLQTYHRNDRGVMFQEYVHNFIAGRDQAASKFYPIEPRLQVTNRAFHRWRLYR